MYFQYLILGTSIWTKDAIKNDKLFVSNSRIQKTFYTVQQRRNVQVPMLCGKGHRKTGAFLDDVFPQLKSLAETQAQRT